jgi:ethanolamine ammonia-lyase small subunit
MERDVWNSLRKYTPARIAIGRAGGSLPTNEVLDFAWAHAEARDAVKAELELEKLSSSIEKLGVKCLRLQSAAADRDTYIRRPDLGRKLSHHSRDLLAQLSSPAAADVALIIADGLSAVAAQEQAVKVLEKLLPMLAASRIVIAPICVVKNARVAIEDEIGHLLQATVAVILLGERPGLGTADCLGAYLVYEPRLANTDANRNCISNIREAGLPPPAAAETIHYLLSESLRRKISGVMLKDERAKALTQPSHSALTPPMP